MTADERKVLAVLEEKHDPDEWFTARQVAEKVGVKPGVARILLNKLWLRGLVDQSSAEGRLIFNLAEE